MDNLQILFPLVFVRCLGYDIGKTDNCIQGSTDLMAHVRQKSGFQFVCFFYADQFVFSFPSFFRFVVVLRIVENNIQIPEYLVLKVF